MKNLRILLITIIATLISCSKNDDVNNLEDGIRVKTYAINADEYNLVYNAKNLLTDYESNTENNQVKYNADNNIIENGNTTYTYNSQGRMSTITILNSRGTRESDVVYINDGKTVQINSIYTPNVGVTGTSQTTVVYNSNNKVDSILEYNPIYYNKYYKIEFAFDDKDNIIQQRTSGSVDGETFTTTETVSYIYDDKLNPYYNTLTKTGTTSNINLISITGSRTLGNQIGYQALYYYSKNNVITINQRFSSGDSQVTQNEYAYNEGNYPIASERTVSYTTGTDSDTYTTYYNWTYEIY
ncbi:hypothetical protein [Algibacter sp. L1A34]|uniref:hypothetical protein n=1 Tax=Algibacter sp. L1A34 TaxID=2686365 RepID=UPI00131D3CB5|nr:hypothetical protein [Algibacter sp. L1A34]